ncbi:MAG: MFS transporter [Rhodoblastus sp.]|nr:MFS transporter [Rhodoblastus sp.]
MPRLLPLIAAIAAISIVGVGLSMTIPLIAVRMEAAGYSASANGWGVAMSGLATILVSPFMPALVRRLGVRRLMSLALALAVASLAGLAFVDNVLWWFPIRFGLGASLTLFFVVSEYAINALAPEERRGLWIGIYSTALYLGFALGPVIIGFVGTEGRTGFYSAIALFMIGGAPIIAAGAAIPTFSERAERPAWAMIFRAPVIMLASLLFGALETGGMGLLPVHALRNGYDAATGALFVSFVAFGNVAFQLPLGLLSDRVDRRKLIVAIAIVGLVGALALMGLGAHYAAFSALLFVWGGIVGGLYMVGLATLGARYTGADLASANSAFVMLYATGMIIGPPVLGATLDASPGHGLFGGVALLFVAYLAVVSATRRGSGEKR